MTDEKPQGVSKHIECPICEFQFPLGAQVRKRNVVCPSCQNKFDQTTATITRQPATSIPTLTPAQPNKIPVPSPESIKPVQQPSVATPAAAAAVPTIGPVPGGLNVKTGSNAARYKPRKKQSLFSQPLVLGLLGLMAFSLIGVLVFVLNRPPAPIADSSGDPATANADAGASSNTAQDDDAEVASAGNNPADPAGSDTVKTTDSNIIDTSDTNAADLVSDNKSADDNSESDKTEQAVAATSVKSFNDGKFPPLRRLTKKQIESIWSDKIRPHLLHLKIENTTGTATAVGTLIDSRGWMVTSLSAIKGAQRIEVTNAARSFADTAKEPPLVDDARNVLAHSVEHDLVILSINRRYVISLAELNIAKDDPVVGGYIVVQSEPPSPINHFGFSEGEVNRRVKFDRLAEATQLLINRNKFSKDVEWLRYVGAAPGGFGAPLVTEDGTVVGFKTSMETESSFFATPSFYLTQLKDSIGSSEGVPVADFFTGADSAAGTDSAVAAGTEANPLDEAGDDDIPLVLPNGFGGAVEPAPPALAADHPHRKISTQLNALGAKLQSAGWQIKNIKSYETVNELIFASFEAESLLMDNIDKNSDEPKDEVLDSVLRKQIDYWRGQFNNNLGHEAITQNLRTDFNAQAMESVGKSTKERFFTAYATVHVPGPESITIDNNPTCVLKVEGSEYYFRIIYDPDYNAMLPGSRWLVSVMLEQGRPKPLKYEEAVLPLRESELFTLIGPMN